MNFKNLNMINTFKTSFNSQNTNFSVDSDNSDLVITESIDYEVLTNKPQINGVELRGDKTFEELDLVEVTNQEIDNLFRRL